MNLRERARDQPCYARLQGVCNGNTETVVLAHLRIGNVAGVGQKPSNFIGFPACASCHDAIDGRRLVRREEIEHDILRALCQWLADCHSRGWIQEARK